MNQKPFIIISPCQFDGDLALGVWHDEYKGWLLGDGDIYTPENLHKIWGDAARELTWSELEAILKTQPTK